MLYYALESVASIIKEGIIIGSENKIDAKGKVNKALAATVIYNIIYNK